LGITIIRRPLRLDLITVSGPKQGRRSRFMPEYPVGRRRFGREGVQDR
jgi:hypothetical protein